LHLALCLITTSYSICSQIYMHKTGKLTATQRIETLEGIEKIVVLDSTIDYLVKHRMEPMGPNKAMLKVCSAVNQMLEEKRLVTLFIQDRPNKSKVKFDGEMANRSHRDLDELSFSSPTNSPQTHTFVSRVAPAWPATTHGPKQQASEEDIPLFNLETYLPQLSAPSTRLSTTRVPPSRQLTLSIWSSLSIQSIHHNVHWRY
jgi:hypothetical protein